jgi:hypothetical protein
LCRREQHTRFLKNFAGGMSILSARLRLVRCLEIRPDTSQGESNMTMSTKVGAGAIAANHNQTGIAVRSNLKAGKLASNHNQAGIPVRSNVKAGGVRPSDIPFTQTINKATP